MRLFNNISTTLFALSALLLSSCSNDYEGATANEMRQATLSVKIVNQGANSRATENITTLNEDYTTKTLRIFAIDKSGRIEANEYIDDLSSMGSSGIYHSFEVTQAPNKKIYVVLNEPASLTPALESVKQQMELTHLSYEIAEALNNEIYAAGGSITEINKMIPMCGFTSVNVTGDCNVVVTVDRVVARVDLMVDKDLLAQTSNVEFNGSTTVNVTGLYYKTSLFKPQHLPTPAPNDMQSIKNATYGKTMVLKLEKTDNSSAQRLFSFYMAERTYNIDMVNPSDNRIAIHIDNVTVDGAIEKINSTILLGNNVEPYIEQINRNHVYRIFATYKGEEKTLEVDDEYAIQDWVIEELDGDIEGVMLAVTNQAVMDWSQLNDSFTAGDVAFGSNRDIEIYIPTSYDLATNKYEFKKCGIVAHNGATYDLLSLSQYGVSDEENFLRQIPWLTNAQVIFDSFRTGHFEFTYTLGATPNHMDHVPLQIVSANVRKQLDIIYDNGYVPETLLQANDTTGCWGDAPNGIIFAKRGDALHPKTTKEVFTSNSEGLYEGDILKSASEADAYCKEKLGPRWYAPNKAQLADIQRHVLELGTSYRFVNTQSSLYWSSQSNDSGSNFWTIDFTKGLNEPEAALEPSTAQHYIRCITNL